MAVNKAKGYSPYQIRLLMFLSIATFFEGYDFIALVQVLPKLVETMSLDQGSTGIMVSIINIGSILSFFIIYLADRLGRKHMLAITIAGYTIASFLTGLAGSPWAFAAIQLLARIFLLGEVAIAMIYAAEEFPANRRGRVIGMLQVSATLGIIFCAGITPILLKTDLGWRSIYFVGTIPLILVAFARRNLKETKRYKQSKNNEIRESIRDFIHLVKGPYAPRVFLIASIWALTYMCAQSLITFWNLHAIHSLGMSYESVSRCIMIAALGSTPLLFGIGRLLELGRRKASILVYTLLILGTIGCYNLTNENLLIASLILSFFAVSGVVPILNAYTVELFPTEMRANAFAWCNSLLGRLGYVFSPLLVGFAALHVGYGMAVTATAIFPLIALIIILKKLPETAGLSLETTSRLSDPLET